MGRASGPADLTCMPSISQTAPAQRDPQPQQAPPRARLEELLGRDFTDFLLDALTDAPPHQGRRGSSSP
jgi:hypothetical protein